MLPSRSAEYVLVFVICMIFAEPMIAVRVFAEDLCAGVGVSITVPNITTTPTTAEASPTAGPASATPTGGVESASAVIRTGHISDILLLSVVGIAVSWLGWL